MADDMNPSVSCIALAFARVPQLEQAIGNFLAQKYDGERELIVLNSFPKQILKGNFPNVRIINLDERPATLGDCRNIAIESAQGEVVLCFDEDDLHHSNFIQSMAIHFEDGIDWVWQDRMFYAENGRIVKTAVGSPNVFGFRKSAWQRCGKYPSMNTGEDQKLRALIESSSKGRIIKTEAAAITFIYQWGASSGYHLSGHGFDEPGAATGYWKVGELVEQQAAAMLIPTGEILLKPTMRLNPDEMIAEWLVQNNMVAEPGANECCIVLLGRLGDLCNLLPVAKHIADRFGKPFWMVSREFADLFDGVSYVTPWVTDLPPAKINEAVALARKRFKNVLVCQVYGDNWQADKLSASYNRESWRLAGFANKFDDHSWKPVFDRRDSGRETVLLGRAYRSICDETTTPMLLVNVTRAMSSPYPPGAALLGEIIAKFSARFHIVNIAELKLERVYDVLGLMERCVALVACDTVHLHLAAAVDCPTIAIVNAIPWLGTELRATDNFVRFTYADSIETIIAGMEKELPQ